MKTPQMATKPCACACGAATVVDEHACSGRAPVIAAAFWRREGKQVLVDRAGLVATGLLTEQSAAAGIWDPASDTRLLLVRSPHGRVHAYAGRCTHLGGRLGYDAVRGMLSCASERRSLFHLDGEVAAGPARQPVASLPCRMRNGWLVITLP